MITHISIGNKGFCQIKMSRSNKVIVKFNKLCENIKGSITMYNSKTCENRIKDTTSPTIVSC